MISVTLFAMVYSHITLVAVAFLLNFEVCELRGNAGLVERIRGLADSLLLELVRHIGSVN